MNHPQKIGRYEVERLLGHGGMAVVYLARDPLMKRTVAIKLLPRQWTFDANQRQRFHREAQIIAALEHPAIVPIYDYGEHEEQPYLVMRYMGGGSLRDRLARAMPLPEAARILVRLAPALDMAHGRGIIHRDLKPDNVLFDEHNEPYLADFGIARMAEATQSMTIVGTPTYMSPEQVQGDRALDYRADIYALGVVLYEMLTGQAPYQANTPPQLMFKHVYEPVPDVRRAVGTLPAGVQTIINRAMAKEPNARYPSVAALAGALQQVAPTAGAAGGAAATVLEMALPGTELELTPPPGAYTPAAYIPPAYAPPPAPPAYLTPNPPPPAPAPDAPLLWRVPAGVGLLVVIGLVGMFCLLAVGGGWYVFSLLQSPTPPPATTPIEVVETTPDSPGTPPIDNDPTPTTPGEPPDPVVTVTLPPDVTAPPSVTEPPPVTPAQGGSQPPPNPRLGDSWVRSQDGMTLVYLPAGRFLMGSNPDLDPDAFDNEFPQHEVSLAPFWLDQLEVSNAQFATFLNARGNQTEDDVPWLDIGDTDVQIEQRDGSFAPLPGRADLPVVEVTWYGAAAYCRWVGGQLPSEAQWEYGARGPANLIYPWGNGFDGQRANFCDQRCDLDTKDLRFDDGFAEAAPVGTFPAGASWAGALDLGGNVWEWVNDWYSDDYYLISPSSNPGGPAGGETKIVRGGSWLNTAITLRTADRLVDFPDTSRPNFGFRCAMPATP